MGIKKSHKFWTVREDKILREMWVTKTPIKEFMPLLAADRTYQSVIAHAQNLSLGPRPIKVRSTYSAVWDEIERALRAGGPLTAKEISGLTGHCARHITDLCNARHGGDEALVHVGHWRRRGAAYGYVEAWCLGDGPDAPKPKAKTRDDINRVRRERRAARANLAAGNPFGTAMTQVLQAA